VAFLPRVPESVSHGTFSWLPKPDSKPGGEPSPANDDNFRHPEFSVNGVFDFLKFHRSGILFRAMTDLQERLIGALSHGVICGMQRVDELIVVANAAMQVHDVPGDIVEFGTATGHTARIVALSSKKRLFLYDSFQGLPEKGEKDGDSSEYVKGSIKTDEYQIYETFDNFGLETPYVKGAWFKDLSEYHLPENISLALLDGDFYESIKTSLELVYPRLSPGGKCLIHDYFHTKLPGVKAAVDEFMADKPEKIQTLYGSHGVPSWVTFTKQ